MNASHKLGYICSNCGARTDNAPPKSLCDECNQAVRDDAQWAARYATKGTPAAATKTYQEKLFDDEGRQ